MFSDEVCAKYKTKGTPKEMAACTRRQASCLKKVKGPSKHIGQRTKKKYNCNTYKFHSIGDYPGAIHEVGTLDGVTMQWVHLPHRFSFVVINFILIGQS